MFSLFSFSLGLCGFAAAAAFACCGYALGCHETNLRRDLDEIRRLSDPAPSPPSALTEEQAAAARKSQAQAAAFAQIQNYSVNDVYRNVTEEVQGLG